MKPKPKKALLLIGHGSKSPQGIEDYWGLAKMLQRKRPELNIGFGFLELAEPSVQKAIDNLASQGVTEIVAVPLVLLGASHLKIDGPQLLEQARKKYPEIDFRYSNAIGISSSIISLALSKIKSSINNRNWDPKEVSIALIGRGSSDPDSNSDLYKIGRLLQEKENFYLVEPGFISLSTPFVPDLLNKLCLLGTKQILITPYFLFRGILVDRIKDQYQRWNQDFPEVEIEMTSTLGPDDLLVDIILERYLQASQKNAYMNCDCCIYKEDFLNTHPKISLADEESIESFRVIK